MHPRRWDFALLPPVPLLVLALFAWGRSLLPERFYCRSVDGRLLVMFGTAYYQRFFSTPDGAPVDARPVFAVLRSHPGNRVAFAAAGVEVVVGPEFDRGYPMTHAALAVHYGWVTATLSALSAWGVVAYRRRRRRRAAGHCRACGYDLTGNQSGACPECGTPAATREAAS